MRFERSIMELSYASKKIANQRRLNIFKLVLAFICDFLVVALLYLFFYFVINPRFEILKTNNSVLISILIAILVIVISTVIVELIYFHKLNKKYVKFYKKLLIDEAMLDGLALFENKIPLNDVEKNIIEKYVGIKNIEEKYAMTQTSSTAYFDLYQIMHENRPAVLIKTKVDFLQNEIVILRNDKQKGELSFESKSLKQYGIGRGNLESILPEFALYTTIGENIYQYIQKETLDELYEFGKFVQVPLTLTLFDDNLFIFIDGWKLNLEKSLFNKEGIAIIDAQIEVLKKLQNYIENMTGLIKKEEE